MATIKKRLVEYLHLKDVGFIEFVFAIIPVLSGYSLGSIPMSFLIWLLLIFIVFVKKGKLRAKNFMPLTIFIVYWVLHEFAIMLVDDVNFIGFLQQLIWFGAVFVLFPVLNLHKLKGAINWVALISMVGILYQWGIISAGGVVTPLGIPGLTMPEVRIEGADVRPCSFFMEPASYVAFMICPLALALTEKKHVWSVIIILSIFLTTSTTGLILSFIMLVMSLFGQKMKTGSIIGVIVIGVGLFYALTHLSAFEYGVNKLENTDVETNVRLSQGPYIVSTMHANEYIFGAPYSTPYAYCKSGRATEVHFYGENVFMSTIWQLILLYGLVGLSLYLYIYWKIIKINRMSLPLVVCLVTAMVSSSYALGGGYVFTLIFLLVSYNNFTLKKLNYFKQ